MAQKSREQIMFEVRERERKAEAIRIGNAKAKKSQAPKPKPKPSLLDSLVNGFRDVTGVTSLGNSLKVKKNKKK